MKIEIEVYKGQTIEYDVEDDKFICDITVEDRFKSTKRKSLKYVRKEIDTFIKLNLEFKPFKALYSDIYGSNRFHECEFKAIRTDGKFVVKDKWSNNHWDKKDLESVYEYNIELVDAKNKLEEEIQEFTKKKQSEIDALFSKLKKMDFSKYEKFIN